MTTYLLPCYGDGHCWIEKVRARNFSDAQQKFINAFTEDYEDIDIPSFKDCSLNKLLILSQVS